MSEMIYSAFGKNIEDMDRDELIKALKIAMDQVKHLERMRRSAVGVVAAYEDFKRTMKF